MTRDSDLFEELLARASQRGAEVVLAYVRELAANDRHLSRWLDVEAAASYLSMTPDALRTMQKRRKVPFVRIPETNRIRFDRIELDRWMSSSEGLTS